MPMRAEFPAGTMFHEWHQESPLIPGQPGPVDARAVLNRPDDVAAAVRALAAGAAVGHGFGGFYAITARGDAESVRRVNQLKGRPLDQAGSIVTTPARMSDVFDWDALPAGLSRARVLELMDAFYALGPFGFRGPAAAHVPGQLTQPADGVRTTQLIAPGYACASNRFLARALTITGDGFLYVTSANRSHHLTGDPDTPAHWQANGLRADFGTHPGFTLLEHADEAAARAAFPQHLPMSTSILGFHVLAAPADGSGDRPCLTLERHGSLHVDDVRTVLAAHGFGLTLGPKAVNRLPLREYPGNRPAPVPAERLSAGHTELRKPAFHRPRDGQWSRMTERWYQKAIIYCLDVETFQDSDGDGVGDFAGLTRRLDYLARLGVDCLWLNPIHPSPGRDGGYEVSDYYNVHPRLGTLGDFAEFLQAADSRGVRVIIDLVVNHTSDQHPWFQSACSSPDSPYRDWYVWSEHEPRDRRQGMVFPGEQDETWTYNETAGAWYFHRFYRFQPDLNISNPRVRDEIKKIASFWLRLGVAGFRMDAAPFVIEYTTPDNNSDGMDFGFLTDLRQTVQWQRQDALLLAEANVDPDQLVKYFGDSGGSANRLHMLFDFLLNAQIMLALARKDPEPVIDALRDTPALPDWSQWATFLRNHDEVDLSRLTADQRQEVFAEFGPDENMRLYGRGIRRRLAPMLGGDQRRIRLAYSLQFTLRGTPVIRYGEEIGMGDDLSLPDRESIRTPMQWSPLPNAGFSAAQDGHLVMPVVTDGMFGYEKVNVQMQRNDPASLLSWFEQMMRTLRECPEINTGTCTHVDVPTPPGLLVHRADDTTGTMLFLHNLGDQEATADVSSLHGVAGSPTEMFADRDYGDIDLAKLTVDGYGYRWICLRREFAL